MLYNERISDERNAGGKKEPLQAGGEGISEGVMRVQRAPKHGVLRWSEERKKQSATPGGKREPLQAGGERISEGVMRVQRTPKHGVLRWSEERKKAERNAGGKRAPAGRRRKDFRRRYESATDTETRSVEVERKKQSATLATNVKLWRVFG